jgi:cytosine deaminase
VKSFEEEQQRVDLTRRILGVSNAMLRGKKGLWDVEFDGDRITSVAKSRGMSQADCLDARGCLVTPPFAVAHVHLDKVMTASRVPSDALTAYQSGRMDARKSIKLASEAKEGYSEADILSRARPLVAGALDSGVTAMRAFADTDTIGGLKAAKALMTLRREFAGRMEIQVVAFPQEGIEADPGAEEYIEKAVEAGADVVGGIPWLEKDRRRQKAHIDKMFAIAKRHGKPVAMLVDDEGDPSLRTLEMLAAKAIAEGMNGRVQACHARAMQLYPDAYAREVALLCSKAGVGVVSSPHTGPLHAPIDLLRRYGVTVALGQDDCNDAYYPFGRCNMLEVAFLASHILRKMTPADVEVLYDMISINPARIIGSEAGAISKGEPADLVVLVEKDVSETLAVHARPAAVISRGAVVSERSSEVPAHS